MKKILFLLLSGILLAACQKDFLDTKPQKALLVPATTADFRALLDNTLVFNVSPGLNLLADGDQVATDAGWNGYYLFQERSTYTWDADIFGTETAEEWNLPYRQVFYANIVLEGADDPEVRGTALFHRGFAFYNLAQLFAPPYHAATANSDPGIPLRTSADVTKKTGRSTLKEIYVQILDDLRRAKSLLPASTTYKTRPTVAAAYGLLARVCLSMEDYSLAGKYADSCLQLRSTLIDYNTLSTTAVRPFPRASPNGNDEVLFYALALDYTFSLSSSPTFMVPELYNSYAASDLRKAIFFRQISPGNYRFKGNYSGILSYFTGLATDEQYLIRAECSARAGNTAAALSDLNTLLSKRWKTGTFTPLTAVNAGDALALILQERHKELIMRGLRWGDLRRLNSDPRFSITLTRQLKGQSYQLQPGSRRYTYPVPPDEMKLNPIPQNER
jgi:hypothetical protein